MSWRITPALTWSETVWNPSMIQTALWLDAADASTVTQSSGLISQVNDKSGNGRNFTASGGARPTYTSSGLNGQTVFTFGGSQYLTSANSASTWKFMHDGTGSSVLVVFKAANVSAPNSLLNLIGSNNSETAKIGFALFYDDRSSLSRQNNFCCLTTRGIGGSPVVSNLFGNNTVLANTPTMVSHVCDPSSGTASSRSVGNVNGGVNIANNVSTNAFSSSDPAHTLQLGATGDSSSAWSGFISELIVISGLATTNTRQRIEGYLAHKWGLTVNLPSDHPYKTVGPTP